jgi:hypothetical protein
MTVRTDTTKHGTGLAPSVSARACRHRPTQSML